MSALILSLEPYGIASAEDAYDAMQEAQRYAEAKALARELPDPTVGAFGAVLEARYGLNYSEARQLAIDALGDLYDACEECGLPAGTLHGGVCTICAEDE